MYRVREQLYEVGCASDVVSDVEYTPQVESCIIHTESCHEKKKLEIKNEVCCCILSWIVETYCTFANFKGTFCAHADSCSARN